MRNKPAASKLEALQKILNLEAETGFQDKAVSGGLDRFLERLISDPHPDVKKLSANGIFNISYRRLSDTRRKAWVSEITRLMGSPARKPERTSAPVTPDSPITELRSVSRGTAAKFSRLSVSNLRDLIYLFPRRHLDYSLRRTVSQLVTGQEQTVVVSLWEVKEIGLGKGGRLRSTEAIVGDETGNIYVIWFGQRYLARTMQRAILIAREGTSKDVKLVLSGKVNIFNGRRQIESPEWEILQEDEMASLVHTGRIVPIYPTTEGFQSQRTLRKIVREALDLIANPAAPGGAVQIEDPLPASIRNERKLLPLTEAISQLHYPDTLEQREAARRSLAFDELLILQLAMARKRQESSPVAGGVPLQPKPEILSTFLKSLPFSLTEGQNDAIRDALSDMLNTKAPMGRLLQGDVGSGKTVVALALLLVTVANGFQGALMAPTEVLAEQHFLNIASLFREFGHFEEKENTFSFSLAGYPKLISVGLLIGSTPAKIKRDLQQRAGDGNLDFLVGTQTLIQQGLELPNLALGIVDEQHRFGVLQRVALRSKGQQPHLLAMTATPIPRSLAETLYGDLDVSIIPKPPSGRPPITTRSQIERDRAEALVVAQAKEGRQAFVVCPLIEESEALQTSAATKEFDRLKATSMAGLRLGLLHGRLSLKEKQVVMDTFRRGQLDVLVCTPVIEVGIDVPNATVMLINGADRFGLAQLHQLRGRVGRGPNPSFCILLAETPSEEAKQRLETLVQSTDGFNIAEMDLRLRGQGDFFGTRQSGLPNLRIAQMNEDLDLISKAREEAIRILKSSPKLLNQKALGNAVERYMFQVIGETA